MTRILITNDDGIESAVLLPLARALADIAQVTVIVPDRQQSGVGHGFTFHSTLQYSPLDHEDVDFYTLNGTPADCVKFGLCKLLKDEQIDLVVSGVNDQINTGVAVYYSGTVAGAREAALMGIPGVAVSAVDFDPANLGYGVAWVVEFVRAKLYELIPRGKYWNVNIPDCTQGPVLGQRFCTMGQVMYEDDYFPPGSEDASLAPEPGVEYQLKGSKPEGTMVPGTDDFEQVNGYVTITPLTLDMGDAAELQRLQDFNNRFSQAFDAL